MGVQLHSQATHPLIQEILFDEIGSSFTTDPSYWGGTPEGSNKTFLEMISNLGQALSHDNLPSMKDKIITPFKEIYENGGLPTRRYGSICEIGEIFFRGFNKSVMPHNYLVVERSTWGGGFPASKRIMIKLANLVLDKEADLEPRIAAYRLFNDIQRPELKSYAEEIRGKAKGIFEKFTKYNVENDSLPKDYFLPPEPPKRKTKGLTAVELGEARRNYHIGQGDLCHIDYGDKKVTAVFKDLDNWFFPNWIYGYINDEWVALTTKGIVSVDIEDRPSGL